MPVRDLIGAAALCVAVALGGYAYGKWTGARSVRTEYAEKKKEAEAELFKLAETVSRQAAEIVTLQGDLSNAIEQLDKEALDAGGGRTGVSPERLRVLDRRWGGD